MSFKVHFRWGNLDLCSGVIAVPIGPNSHTFTVILAVFAPQPRWPCKPWKGPLIIYAIQQWKKNQSAIIHWTLFTFTWLLTKSTGSSSSPPRTEWNFWGFSKTHKFSSCYFSSATPQINSPKGNFSTIQHSFRNLSYIKRLLLPDVNLGSNPSIFIHL